MVFAVPNYRNFITAVFTLHLLVQVPSFDLISATEDNWLPTLRADGILVASSPNIPNKHVVEPLLLCDLFGFHEGLDWCWLDVLELMHREESAQVKGDMLTHVFHNIFRHLSNFAGNVTSMWTPLSYMNLVASRTL